MCPTDLLHVEELGLGGAGLGNHRHAIDDDTAARLLEEAWANDVRLFDTAPHYGLGLSELRLGEFLRGRPRDAFRVSSKVGRRLVAQDPRGALDDEGFVVPAAHRREWDFSSDGIRATIEASLTRLGLDHLDAAYLHDPERWDLESALRQGLPALLALREEGLVRSIGVASMEGEALVAAARTGEVDELMVAGRYTLMDHEVGRRLLPLCESGGIAVVAAAVFNGGLLATTPTPSSSYDYDRVDRTVLERAQALDRVCRAHDVPLQAAALQFPLRSPAVRAVVVGSDEAGQITTNRRLLRLSLPDALWDDLERVGGVLA